MAYANGQQYDYGQPAYESELQYPAPEYEYSALEAAPSEILQPLSELSKQEEERKNRTARMIAVVICLFLLILAIIGLGFYVRTKTVYHETDDETEDPEYVVDISPSSSGGVPPPSTTPTATTMPSSPSIPQAVITSTVTTTTTTTTTTYKPAVPPPVPVRIRPLLCEIDIVDAVNVSSLPDHCDFFVLVYKLQLSNHPSYSYMRRAELDPPNLLGQFMGKKVQLTSSDVILSFPLDGSLLVMIQSNAGRFAVARGISQLLSDNRVSGLMLHTSVLRDHTTAINFLQGLSDEFSGGYYTLLKYSTIPDRITRRDFISTASQIDRVYLVIETHSKFFPNPLFPNVFTKRLESNYSIMQDLEEVVDVQKTMPVGSVGIALRIVMYVCPGNLYKDMSTTECNPMPHHTRKLCRMGILRLESLMWSLGTNQYTPRKRSTDNWPEIHFYESDYTISKKAEIAVSFLSDAGISSFVVMSGFQNDLTTTYADCSRPPHGMTKSTKEKLDNLTKKRPTPLQLHRHRRNIA